MMFESTSDNLSRPIATGETRQDDRVYGMECNVRISSESASRDQAGTVENESPGGMAIQLDDASGLRVDGFLMVSDFDGDRLGVIKHVTSTNDGYTVGVQWQ